MMSQIRNKVPGTFILNSIKYKLKKKLKKTDLSTLIPTGSGFNKLYPIKGITGTKRLALKTQA